MSFVADSRHHGAGRLDRPEPAGVVTLLARAQALVVAAAAVPDPCSDPGMVAEAVAVLSGVDPAAMPDDDGLLGVVSIFLDNGVQLGATARCAWWYYAYQVSLRTAYFGPDDACTLDFAAGYVLALHAAGRPGAALPTQRDIIAAERRAGNLKQAAEDRIYYAVLLHHSGACHEAATEIGQVWQLWHGDFRSDAQLGAWILRQYLQILDSCGRISDYRDVYQQAPFKVARQAREKGDLLALLNLVPDHTPVCTAIARPVGASGPNR